MAKTLVVFLCGLALASCASVRNKRAGAWVEYDNKEYLYVSTPKTFDDARRDCLVKGGDLLVPDSAAENNFILGKKWGVAWMAVTDRRAEKTWLTAAGKALKYTNWSPGEPNDKDSDEDCAEFLTNGKWNDRPCHTYKIPYICEKEGCGGNPADVVFVLDASGSVGAANFQTMLAFIKKFTSSFDIGPTQTQVGVVTYATNVVPNFQLNTHKSKTTLDPAISAIKYTSGGTDTAKGINYMTNTMFTAANGARKNAVKIGIVMTDGSSNDKTATLQAAAAARAKGISMFAIGIGSGIGQAELNGIGSDPDKDFVFVVNNFAVLDNIKAILKKKTCEVPKPPPIDGGWSGYGSWSQCSVTCGSGTQFQERTCTNPAPAFGGKYCTGSDRQTKVCKASASCAVDGKWSAFGAWSKCPVTCGGGKIFRERQCNNPAPKNGGKNCVGAARETKDCATAPCPVHGKWSAYGAWSTCSKSCGGGTQYRDRACNNPAPLHGGNNCVGAARETRVCNTQKCKTCGFEADITFVIDASGSVQAANFEKMKDFIKQVASEWEVGPQHVRIGVVKFSSNAIQEFHMDRYNTETDVVNAVSKISYTKGGTNTALALKLAREQSFATAHVRPGVPHIAIVMTDGRSGNAAATANEAKALIKAGVTVFAIGIGPNIQTSELNAIASDPDSDYVIKVAGFDGLQALQVQLAAKACAVTTTPAPPTTTQIVTVPPTFAPSACGAQADIIFVLDSSGSVGAANFKKQLAFVHDVVSQFDIAPDKIRVGVLRFHTSVFEEFPLNKYTDKAALLRAIDAIKYTPGGTETHKAIKYLRENAFTAAKGDRPNVVNIGVVMTDGQSYRPATTASESAAARAAKITMMAVGIGSGVRQSELNAIASDPDSQHAFSVQNFDALKNMGNLFTQKTCAVAPTAVAVTPTTPSNCGSLADIVFVLDSSGSVGAANFEKVKDFVKDIVNDLDIGANSVRVGVVKFHSRPYSEFHLNKYYDKKALANAVDGIKYTRGGTITSEGIKMMTDLAFKPANGDRPNVQNIGIVITDGKSNNGRKFSKDAADAARKAGIEVFAIGVGSGVDQNELKDIGNDPDKDYVFTVGNFDALKSIKSQLTVQTCKVIPTGTIVPPTVPTAGPDPCRDVIDCESYGKSMCTNYPEFANGNCQRYCGICTPQVTVTPAPEVCKDTQDCRGYNIDDCKTYEGFMKTNCKSFCGFCSTNTITGGYFGKCFYKGQTYSQGDKWSDGCEYECECIDGAGAKYQCYNKCPIYSNLPSQCTLTRVPGQCCMQPVCNWGTTFGTFTGTGVGTLNGIDVCVYKGTKYYQGKLWQDGCDSQCQCIDAKTGYYECQDLCPTYTNLPSQCKMEAVPGQCCAEPRCNWQTNYGSFTGIGAVTGTSAGQVPTTPPPCVDKIPNCNEFAIPWACGEYKSWAENSCRKSCNLCTGTATPGPDDFCLYKGQKYQHGASWNDGCDTKCTCENAVVGFYRCENLCPSYPVLPAGCQLTTVPNECCQQVRCSNGNFIGSNTGNGVFTGTGVVQPGTGGTGTGGTGTANKLTGCFYKGQYYLEGQKWNDGCSYNCICEDGATGQYKCLERCPKFENLPPQCKLAEDPNDLCCQYPSCVWTGGGTTFTGIGGVSGYIPVPIFGPAIIGIGTPTNPGGITGGTGTGTTGTGTTGTGTGKCVFKGKQYSEGQTWRDGCDLSCTCVHGASGSYRCSDICPTIPNLPPQCTLVTDPKEACCKIPQCSGTGSVATTVQPRPQSGDYCYYKGRYYQQGQTWDDGCASRCRCEDAQAGFYSCSNRCPTYPSIPYWCRLVTDPKDSCCRVPSCNPDLISGGASGSGQIIPSIPGVITGTGTATGAGSGGNIGYCMYGGNKYYQYQIWQDGCDYNCECVDSNTGSYTCQQKCSRYANLPSECKLIQDPKDQCCQIPQCDFSSRTTQAVVTGTGYSCTFNGVRYNPGQSWDVGCQYRCTCENGFYKCQQRCSQYASLPAQCRLEPDPSDTCCMLPTCDWSGGTQITATVATITGVNPAQGGNTGGVTGVGGSVPVGTVSTFVGIGSFPPGYTGSRNGCFYKGTLHATGSSWADGCDFDCQCIDGTVGMYQCRNKCPQYPNLPNTCSLVTSPGQCCKVVQCSNTGVGGGTTANPGTGTGTGTCRDKLPNCNNYPQSACEGIYQPWARDNCANRCNLCGSTGGSTGGTGTGTGTGGSSANGTIAVITGNNGPVISETTNKCLYKGKLYNKDEVWYDGCDYRCSCGSAGKYTCYKRCPTWQLPSACSLQAPEFGKCCSKPVCPAGYTIQYPDGYVDQ
ncbi:uncharacterized protein LOC106173996 isoform X2 [Lingula anatina]|uniref:Uncharacterized protein LOC106173996 isoform X2 n=1 Tax=Lingula anatina TaxID=7574 RepID=A0A1S3JK67_LINAN|nr:uncharacterized protein LOC106173996 isoform X2 [Lingula anatina]|eukprot:XP_013410815.1 uncharacterized protein LOC106173996 isoform X2 [Lingula anatina]